MKMLLAGQWVDRDERIEVRNPYSDEVIDTVPVATVEDVRTALDSAERGLEIMRKMPALERSRILFEAAGILRDRLEDFVVLLASEVGKTLREARGEIGRAYETLLWQARTRSASSGRPFRLTRPRRVRQSAATTSVFRSASWWASRRLTSP